VPIGPVALGRRFDLSDQRGVPCVRDSATVGVGTTVDPDPWVDTI